MRLRLSMHAAKAGSWIWYIETSEIIWDDRMQEIFGFEPGTYDGTYESWKSDVHPDDVEEADRVMVDALKRGANYNFQHRLNVKSEKGRWRTLNAQAVVISNKNDDRTQMVGFCIDITERKLAEEEKLELEKQLQQSQKMESIGTLAGGIAHEFNNMLAIIIGNNELIMEDYPQGSPGHESTEEIRIAGIRAKDVVKQLLTFSRQDDTVKKVMNFKYVVQEFIKLIRSSTSVNIKIEQKLPAGICPIIGNSSQVNQLLLNLCNNAIDAVPEMGGVITVELLNEIIENQQTKYRTELSPGQYVKLMVSDNGVGMEDDIRDRIFEPFYTTKDIGEGSGIGMAIVHGIINKHDGSIIVDSKPYHHIFSHT